MARMIPPRIAPNTRSPGEIEVFERLRDDPATEDWIVLHSLDIAEHRTQLAGEVDFVVIVPGHGVLCLEVKGCRSLRRENGEWYYGREPKPDRRGPFRQASEAMYSVKHYLEERDDRLRPLLYWTAVIFPFIDVPYESVEWHDWQLIDRQPFKDIAISTLLAQVLARAHRFATNTPRATWYQPDTSRPSLATSNLAANLLRPHFEAYQSPADRANRRAHEIKHFTEEQYSALDAMEENERVIFTGPAGTGKTLLAIEAARRGATQGKSVLFVCFNRLLGSWLKEQIGDMPEITTRTLHGHMLAIVGGRTPETAPNQYWTTELPEQACYALLDAAEGGFPVYDLLIVDEAQDILTPAYLDFLELCLDGGLASGRWLMFGDFEMQMIYGGQASTIHTILAQRLGQAPRYALRINCRNTPRIAETVRLLGQMNPGYRRILRPDNQVEPKISIYSTENQKRKLLVKSLDDLLAEGFAAEDIVILIPHGRDSIIPSLLGKDWDGRLLSLRQLYRTGLETRGRIKHGTIHYFKGMEAPVIVVADVDDITTEKGISLLYIALSRALHRLVILLSEDVQRDFLAALTAHTEENDHG